MDREWEQNRHLDEGTPQSSSRPGGYQDVPPSTRRGRRARELAKAADCTRLEANLVAALGDSQNDISSRS